MVDSIRLKCDHCAAGLKASTNLAGKTLECPKCGQPIQVPSLIEQGGASDELGLVLEPGAPPATQVCPHCHAQIPALASKCRQCGEFVQRNTAPATSGDDSKMHPAEYAVAVFLAPIGLGIGVLWSIQKLRKARPMLLVSVPMTALIVAGALSYVMLRDPGNVWTTPTPTKDFSRDRAPYEIDGGELFPDERVERPTTPLTAGLPDLEKLKEQPEEIQRAMRANVRIDTNGGLGSGVIVRIENAAALILTNRHVVDEVYTLSRGQQLTPLSRLPSVKVTFVTGVTEPGKVLWVGEDRVDLALVRTFCPAEGVRSATWTIPPAVNQGDPVFAVGNPAGLGWTLTRGTVSALRQHDGGGREIPVIQTDTAINPGNSGGGLYTAEGKLVGVNNFILDPARAQRVGFAIHLSVLDELASKPFELEPAPE